MLASRPSLVLDMYAFVREHYLSSQSRIIVIGKVKYSMKMVIPSLTLP